MLFNFCRKQKCRHFYSPLNRSLPAPMPVHIYTPRHQGFFIISWRSYFTYRKHQYYFQTRLTSALFTDRRQKNCPTSQLLLMCINKPHEWTASPVQVAEVTRLTVPAAQHFRSVVPGSATTGACGNKPVTTKLILR